MSQQDHKDFFISYNGADQRWAEWIAWQLEEAAYAVILQAWDFLPGSNFVVQMDRALTLAPRMIAVLSPQYLSALYTQPEWAAAFRHDPKGEQSLLIPVRVQPCEVTGLLGPIVYVDLVGRDEATARQRLLAAVRHERAKPAQAPVFPQTMQHTITKQLNFPGDLPPIWNMPHQRDPLFLGREQFLQELHSTLATHHHVLLFEPAGEREAGTSGAIDTAVEYAYRYRSDYQVIAWIQADSREAFRSDLLSLAAALHLPQANPSDQDPLTAVVQWLRTHQHWLLVLDQVDVKEVLTPLMPLPEQGHLLVVTSTRSLESLAPLLELSQVPLEERTVLTQLSQVVGAALQGPQGRMPLGLEPITIGRASTNQVILSDPSVSSRHAIIELKDQAYWITDTGSTNGTFLNQQRLVPQVPSQLHPGDTIRFGTITCTYEVIDRPSRSPVSSTSSEQGSTSAGAYAPSSPVIEKQQRDRVGQRFGNYRLSRLLGLGGFAEVYLGEHIFLDTQTAVKVLYTQLVGQDVEQFRQEARTIAHLEHPHIVRLLDFGIEGSTPYLIMSYAPNGTMRQRYPKGTRLPMEQVVSYVKQIAEALQYAHDHKIIHRDIKPENILFGQDDQVVLSDFGIALVTQSSRFQQPNDMAGTIAYMAPEQIDAHTRPASDQYSLGIVVYEWLCGERPFHGSFKEIAVKHQLVAPPSLREKVPSLSAEVEQVVMTALAKDPKARFGSMQAFAIALEQASQVKQPEPEPVIPISETTDTDQSQQPTETATPVPVIPSSQQVKVSEVSADISAQPHTIIPLSGNERLPQAEEERRQAEEETARQENEQADKLEEERVHKEEETALAPTELATSAHQTPLPTEVARSSKPPALQPDAMVAVKPAKPGATRRFVLIGLAGLVIVALASGIAWFTVHHGFSGSGTITEFPLPTAGGLVGSSPLGITAGPDGNLWFTEYFGNKIGRISPSGTITEFPLPTASSLQQGITAGPDGNLWFTESGSNQIGRISPSGTITEFPLPTAGPWEITTGPDGNLWFTQFPGNKIGRISPGGTITEFPLPTGGSSPWGITAGPDGNLWFTESDSNKIGRISPSGTITEFPVLTPVQFHEGGYGPREITAGPDGNLWFTENESNKIGRISPSGTITEFPLPTAGDGPREITAGPDGNLWFTEFGGDKIGRFTPGK